MKQDPKGLYYAVVISIDKVSINGTIAVRIPELEHGMVFNSNTHKLDNIYNLNQHPETADKESKCFWARLLTPYGGVSREGMLFVPSVGSRGIVSFINNDVNFPVWLGNVTGLHNVGDKTVNFLPASNLEADSSEYENVNFETADDVERIRSRQKDLLKIDQHTGSNRTPFYDNPYDFIVNIKRKDVKNNDDNSPTMFYSKLSANLENFEITLGDKLNSNFVSLKMNMNGISLEAGAANEVKSSLKVTSGGNIITKGNMVNPGGSGGGTVLGEGENDSFVKFKALKEIVEMVKTHVHDTAQGPTSPSTDLQGVSEEMEKTKTKNVRML